MVLVLVYSAVTLCNSSSSLHSQKEKDNTQRDGCGFVDNICKFQSIGPGKNGHVYLVYAVLYILKVFEF